MTSEGLRYWIDTQLLAMLPESVTGQFVVLMVVIVATLCLAALFRAFARIFPIERPGGSAGDQVAQPIRLPASALKSTPLGEVNGRSASKSLDLSSRQKKKMVKIKPKKNRTAGETGPDPMFLPPYDTNVPYRDRIAMIGAGKAP